MSIWFFVGKQYNRLNMGRDDAMNVRSSVKQIYPLCTREHISQFVICPHCSPVLFKLLLYHIRQDFSITSNAYDVKATLMMSKVDLFILNPSAMASHVICMFEFHHRPLGEWIYYLS